MLTLIAAFGATFGVMALMLSVAGRLSAETLAVALLILVFGFIAVLFSTDSLRARPVGAASGFQLFTRRHSRRWPLPVVLVGSLLAVAYVAFRPAPPPTAAPQPSGVTTEVLNPPVVASASAAVDAPVPAAVQGGPTPLPTPVASVKDVEAAVEAWRSAWAARDLSRYLAAYTPDYRPADGLSHDAWVAQRKERLRSARGLRVQVDQLKVEVEGDRATARFLQRYRAGSLDDQVRKRLVLVQSAEGWKISEEAVEPAGKP